MGETDNEIGDEGAFAIAEALEINTVLTTLELIGLCLMGLLWTSCLLLIRWFGCIMGETDNDIGDEGAYAIAEALEINTVLTTLNLNGLCLVGLLCGKSCLLLICLCL